MPGARRRGVGIVLAGLALASSMAGPASGAVSPGIAGTDTSLAATDSQVTVGGSGPFASLKIKVNQTRNLVNQAVSITWEGAKRTLPATGAIDSNYLQIMQCWGEDDGTNQANPGPPPEQCVFGATEAIYGGTGRISFNNAAGSYVSTRIVSRKAWANFDSKLGAVDDAGQVWKPFKAVDGTFVGVHQNVHFNPQIVGGDFWLNPYFNIVTTNEIVAGRTGPSGKGAELFEVTTGLESSGLGCGQQVEPVPGAKPKVPKCWIVIVPRGSPADENVGTPGAVTPEQNGVITSPLGPVAWPHRIAIPLQFTPVDSPCKLADTERRLVGTELAITAISSWQPALCTTPGRPPYSFATVSDAAARQQLLGAAPGGPGMVVVSRPFDPSAVPVDNPVTYAPIALTATVVGFNVERHPKLDADADERALSGVRVAAINLTPRLVAKLLTQSYGQQVMIANTTPPYEWLKKNPAHLGADPDFLQFNPEFTLLDIAQPRNFGGFLMPARNSDAAAQVWDYLLADPESKAWLDGAPDPWGMKVNPVYASTAAANTTGVAFGASAPDSYPKSDPYCYQAPPQGERGKVIPPALCGTDWLPYTSSSLDAARFTRAADDGARIVNRSDALSPADVYRRDLPQAFGTRAMLALTDAASALQFGLQTAALSRAGDNRPDRTFVAPDAAGLTSGVESMTPRKEPRFLEPNSLAAKPAAYPLTALTYAAVTPLTLDDKARSDYSAFVDYAVGPGQVSGLELGQLPRGYAPLPATLRAQATAAARTIRDLKPATATTVAPPATAPRPPVPPARPTAVPASSGSGSGFPNVAPPEAAIPSAPGSTSDTTATPPAPSPPKPPAPATPRPVGLATPALVAAKSRYAFPALLVIGLLSALGAIEITKRPRHGASGTPVQGGAA